MAMLRLFRGITDQRSMAGTAPTDSHFTRTLNAGPVQCSVWLGVGRFALSSASICDQRRRTSRPCGYSGRH